jgi:glycosyltransferase involved in cell wall biosynthesis
VVVSDDTPGDEVKQLVETYHSKFKLSYHKNSPALGTPANWNKAIELSKGEIIKIMHHDDWFDLDNSLQFFVAALESKEVGFAFCASKILNVKDGTYSYNSPSEEFLDELYADPMALFNNNKIGSPSAVIFKRSELVPFDIRMKYLVDLDLYIRVLKKTQFSFIKLPLIINTSNNEEQVTAQSVNKITQVGEYCYFYNKHFGEEVPGPKFRKFFKELFAWYGLKDFKEITSQGWEHPRPENVFKWLLFRSKLSKLFS